MKYFIHDFMEQNGVPVTRTSKECMDFLMNVMGYSFEASRGVLGLAVARGYIHVSSFTPIKTYN